ncbi:1820_t:CDS:10 [Diversispora eburnea]|uniref:1820_t:CDS:1 n=1 Tax=Diversispora eburnea TaxID=1213867 RepID=A0A9N8ZHF3_9GLOM|nr:1820_t:CDS:10 [Diversispora eburnea]
MYLFPSQTFTLGYSKNSMMELYESADEFVQSDDNGFVGSSSSFTITESTELIELTRNKKGAEISKSIEQQSHSETSQTPRRTNSANMKMTDNKIKKETTIESRKKPNKGEFFEIIFGNYMKDKDGNKRDPRHEGSNLSEPGTPKSLRSISIQTIHTKPPRSSRNQQTCVKKLNEASAQTDSQIECSSVLVQHNDVSVQTDNIPILKEMKKTRTVGIQAMKKVCDVAVQTEKNDNQTFTIDSNQLKSVFTEQLGPELAIQLKKILNSPELKSILMEQLGPQLATQLKKTIHSDGILPTSTSNKKFKLEDIKSVNTKSENSKAENSKLEKTKSKNTKNAATSTESSDVLSDTSRKLTSIKNGTINKSILNKNDTNNISSAPIKNDARNLLFTTPSKFDAGTSTSSKNDTSKISPSNKPIPKGFNEDWQIYSISNGDEDAWGTGLLEKSSNIDSSLPKERDKFDSNISLLNGSNDWDSVDDDNITWSSQSPTNPININSTTNNSSVQNSCQKESNASKSDYRQTTSNSYARDISESRNNSRSGNIPHSSDISESRNNSQARDTSQSQTRDISQISERSQTRSIFNSSKPPESNNNSNNSESFVIKRKSKEIQTDMNISPDLMNASTQSSTILKPSIMNSKWADENLNQQTFNNNNQSSNRINQHGNRNTNHFRSDDYKENLHCSESTRTENISFNGLLSSTHNISRNVTDPNSSNHREYNENRCQNCYKTGHHYSKCAQQKGMGHWESREREEPKSANPSNILRSCVRVIRDCRPSEISPKEAWEKLIQADQDDFRNCFEEYAKASPNETFQLIEEKLRKIKSKARIMAVEREIPQNKCLVDLQGNAGKKYYAQILFLNSQRPVPGNIAGSAEENFTWLADAGFMCDDPTPFCPGCKSKGHWKADCPDPKPEEPHQKMGCNYCKSLEHDSKYCDSRDRLYKPKCYSCNESGHVTRSCNREKNKNHQNHQINNHSQNYDSRDGRNNSNNGGIYKVGNNGDSIKRSESRDAWAPGGSIYK